MSFHTIYLLNGFRKSTPQHNRQLTVLYYLLKQSVDGFVREQTFSNHLIDTLCEMRWLAADAGRIISATASIDCFFGANKFIAQLLYYHL